VAPYTAAPNDHVDFMRDKLSVYIENDEVVVKIIDTTSGGSATHHSGYDVNNFERTYGQTN
ncbi:hypothetical protein ACLBQC_32205, partial [Klebsiella pneumoniae]|uniref:hypothetical protein n=1 Tax=Klebsiella pneumoniae TaxID=573 RepID=UPI003968D02F